MEKLNDEKKQLEIEQLKKSKADLQVDADLIRRYNLYDENQAIGLRQKIEDTARLIAQTGGINDRQKMQCRKLHYFGDVGEIYFEQPSINLIQSGMWSCSHMRTKLVRIETMAPSSEDPYFDAIRFTYKTESALVAQGGKPMILARLWLGSPKGGVTQTVNLLDSGTINSVRYSASTKRVKHFQLQSSKPMTHPIGNCLSEQLLESRLHENEFIVGAYGYLSSKAKASSKDPVLMGLGFIAAKLVD